MGAIESFSESLLRAAAALLSSDSLGAYVVCGLLEITALECVRRFFECEILSQIVAVARVRDNYNNFSRNRKFPKCPTKVNFPICAEPS